MVKLSPDTDSLMDTTFYRESLQEAFQKKHPDIEAQLKATYSDGKNEVAVLKGQIPTWIVKDFTCYTTLQIDIGDDNVYVRQFSGFCGAAVIYGTRPFSLNDGVLPYVEDLLYLMGYSVVMYSENPDKRISSYHDPVVVRFGGWIEERGYKPFMNLRNRRTGNNINLYYKQLKFTP